MIKLVIGSILLTGLMGCGGGGGSKSANETPPVSSSSTNVAASSLSSVNSSASSLEASSVLSSNKSSSSQGSSASALNTAATYVQVNKAFTFVYLYVNGLEKMRWGYSGSEYFGYDSKAIERLGEIIDISKYLVKGDNEVTLIASSADSLAEYDVKLWHQGQLLLNESGSLNRSNTSFSGITFERTLTLHSDTAKDARTLSITSPTGGEALYINNVYTGKKLPASFKVPAGEYRIGIGESTDTPGPNSLTMTGQFRQKDIVVGEENVEVHLGDVPLLTTRNLWKVAIVPVTNVHFGLTNTDAMNSVLAPLTDIGFMDEDDIQVAKRSVEVTSENWIKPMTYGLFSWQVELLTPIQNRVYLTDHLRLEDVFYPINLNGYDMVIYVIADITQQRGANNERIGVVHGIGGTGGRTVLTMPASWLNAKGDNLQTRLNSVAPSSGMVHEFLHNFDGYGFFDYNGVEWLHGAEEHNYTPSSCGFPEWMCWYQQYIRAQVPENNGVNLGVYPDTNANGKSIYIGDFNIMRAGRGVEQIWSFSKGPANLMAAESGLCLDPMDNKLQQGSLLGTRNCASANAPLWVLQRATNETYQILNQESQFCIERAGEQLIQHTCKVDFKQRFIIGSDMNRFHIKDMSGNCLQIIGNEQFAWANCNESDNSQHWQYRAQP